MGGVKTDVWGATSIPGLYAAGEVACVSVHGGNRLGANSLLDTLIFGRRSGEHAAKRARAAWRCRRPRDASLRDEQQMIDDDHRRASTGGRRVSEIKDELGTMMNEKCAVFRDEAGLTEALEIVRRLKEEAATASIDDRGTVFNQDVLGAIELGYMLDVRRVHRRRRARAQGVARRAVPPRLPQAQRRRVAQAHHPVASTAAAPRRSPTRR